MAKRKSRRVVELQRPTPERMAHDEHVEVQVGAIDSTDQKIGIAMRLRHVSLVDRWLVSGHLDQAQVDACTRYARLYVRAGFRRTIASPSIARMASASSWRIDDDGSVDALAEMSALAPLIGRDLDIWERVVIQDRVSDLHTDMLSARQREIATAIARHVTTMVSADLVSRWGMRLGT
jgi:hypothetical protein